MELNNLLLYKKLQKDLMKYVGLDNCIGYKKAEIKICCFRIPKKLTTEIIKEMVGLKLIEKINDKPGGKLRILMEN